MSVDQAPVPFLSPAVQRGFGFFETALLAGRRAVLWEPHLDRMHRILSGLDLPKPSRESLNAAARRVLDASPPKPTEQRALRLTWFAEGDDLDDPASFRLEAHLTPIPESRLARRSGSHCVSLPPDLQRDTPAVKSTSYFAAVQGGRLAKKAGGDEGLFRSPNGTYLEGTTTGLAAWNGGTPVLAPKGVLPSVTARRRAGRLQRGDPDGDPRPGYSRLSRGRGNRMGFAGGGRMGRNGSEVAGVRSGDGVARGRRAAA